MTILSILIVNTIHEEASILIKWFIKQSVKRNILRLLKTEYDRSLWEGVVGILHHGMMDMMENEYRSNAPFVLQKPIGASQKYPHFDGLLLNPAQLYQQPLYAGEKVDLSISLGKNAKKPLKISIPIMISGMAYGIALSKEVTLAIAKASGQAGIAYNPGQGGVLKEHRQLAHRLIVQIHGSSWEADTETLQQADAVEIKIGQGANGGAWAQIRPQEHNEYDQEVLKNLGLMNQDKSRPIIIPSSSEMLNQYGGLPHLIKRLHQSVPGIPVIVKLAASHYLEQDMEIAISSGADVLAIDGAQGGTHGSPSILVNDFGLPTLSALVRAVRFLRQKGWDQKIDLVISGGLRTPGDVLKALALGANAVYLGTAALYAVTHVQLAKTLPIDPPTSLTWTTGHLKDQFNKEDGATSLLNFLLSFAEELKFGLHALGKKTIQELSFEDLVAWDADVARITGLPLI